MSWLVLQGSLILSDTFHYFIRPNKIICVFQVALPFPGDTYHFFHVFSKKKKKKKKKKKAGGTGIKYLS